MTILAKEVKTGVKKPSTKVKIFSIPEGHAYKKESYLKIDTEKTCECKPNHLNCMTAKEWLKSQLGVWEFFYQKRDIRDKNIHPATFPISLATKVIELFSHKGELVLGPFVGSGTMFNCVLLS